MTQAQQTLQAPRVALMSVVLAGTLFIGIVSGIAVAGTSLLGGLGTDSPRISNVTPAVLLSGLQWERQREQQRMFGDTIPAAWFQDSAS
jgi:hypothetical protein